MNPPQNRPHLTFAVIATSAAAYSMLQSLIIPVLPTLQTALHTSQENVTWLVTAYLLSASVATPILGRLGDVYGKERVLVQVMTVLAVGTVVCGLATSLSVMIVGRVLQGIASAIFPLAFGIIRDEFPTEKVAGAIGTISSLLAVGGGLGIVLAGPIAQHLNYHWLFWAPLPFVVLGAIGSKLFIPESDVRDPSKPSARGAVVLAAWLVALLVGVSQGPVWGWTDPRVIGLFVAAVVLLVTWVVVEDRAPNPLVDMTLMRETAVMRANIAAFCLGVVMYSTFFVVPEFVQTPAGHGYGFASSVTQSGLFILPMTITMFFAGQLVGRLTASIGSRMITIIGTVVTTASVGLLYAAHDQQWEFYVVMAVFGAGAGLAFSAVGNLVVEAVPAHQTGLASGVNTNIRSIGGAIGGQIAGVIITSGVAAGEIPHLSGYTNTFLALTIAGVLAVIAAVAVPKARTFAADLLDDGDADAEMALTAAH